VGAYWVARRKPVPPAANDDGSGTVKLFGTFKL
jgi:hypothetical protein